MKRIGIDMRMLHSSGIGTCLQNLVPSIIKANTDLAFNLYGPRSFQDFDISFKNEQVNWQELSAPIYSIQEQLAFLSLNLNKLDLFWSPHFNIPLCYSKNLLVTIHDAFHISPRNQVFIKSKLQLIYAKFFFSRVAKQSKKIICDSIFTKNELLRYTKVDEKKLQVIYNGVNQSWHELIPQKDLPHPKPYLLYVGNVKPHKNLKILLEAFELIQNKIPHDLLIVGQKDGMLTRDNLMIEKAKENSTRIHMTGKVPFPLLQQFFAHATCFIFPSFYEGFGLPPLEAMAVSCPVIASDQASIPEICGEAPLYFNPNNREDLAKKIQQVIGDKSLRNDMIKKGKRHSEDFTWNKSIKATTQTIKSLLL